MRISRLEIEITEPEALLDITKQVKAVVKASGVENGVLFIFCPHTTAGILIQENTGADLVHDVLLALANAVPKDTAFQKAEANSHAHVKAAIIGSSQVVPIEKGKLVLGAFQSVYLCEFAGPRSRQVLLKIIAD